MTAAVVVAFFHRGGNYCLPQHRRDGFSLITSGHGETLCYNELSQMGSIIEVSILEHVRRFQSWDFIEGFFCSSMFSCFKRGMLRFWSIQPT